MINIEIFIEDAVYDCLNRILPLRVPANQKWVKHSRENHLSVIVLKLKYTNKHHADKTMQCL